MREERSGSGASSGAGPEPTVNERRAELRVGSEGRDSGRAPAVLLCSRRPEVREALCRALRELDPKPRVVRLDQCRGSTERFTVGFVDLTAGARSPESIRKRVDARIPLVAVLEGAGTGRLLEALTAGFEDYLFYPVNPAELGLLWRGYREGPERPGLILEEGAGGRLTLVIPSAVRYLRPAVGRVVEACRLLEWPGESECFRLRAAVGEALSNAVLYGNEEDPRLRVEVRADMRDREIRVTVADEGDGFDPSAVPDPTGPGRIERAHGRGLFLLRSRMDEVRYNDRGNQVTLVLRRDDDAS